MVCSTRIGGATKPVRTVWRVSFRLQPGLEQAVLARGAHLELTQGLPAPRTALRVLPIPTPVMKARPQRHASAMPAIPVPTARHALNALPARTSTRRDRADAWTALQGCTLLWTALIVPHGASNALRIPTPQQPVTRHHSAHATPDTRGIILRAGASLSPRIRSPDFKV